MDVPVIPEHFYATVCHVCKQTVKEVQLKRCSNCKMIAYCSRDHQRKHWREHKELCQIVSKNAINPGILKDSSEDYSDQWRNIQKNSLVLAEILLKRKLHHVEKQMFLAPRVCQKCKTSEQDPLFCCTLCYAVCYCSEAHLSEDEPFHSKHCSLLRLCRLWDTRFTSSDCLDIRQIISLFPFSQSHSDVEVPPNMYSYINQLHWGNRNTVSLESSPLQFLLLTELLTFPLTVVYVLKTALDISVLNQLSYLEVHVLGSDFTDCNSLGKWEVILHHMTKLKLLKMVFIGPELDFSVMPHLNMCDSCKDCGKQVEYEFSRTLYHDYINSLSEKINVEPPHLVIAYNCGFHADERWNESLPYLTRSRSSVFAFTSYTESECKADLETLKMHGKVKNIVGPIRNPFQSERPVRDIFTDAENDIFYINGFLSYSKPNS